MLAGNTDPGLEGSATAAIFFNYITTNNFESDLARFDVNGTCLAGRRRRVQLYATVAGLDVRAGRVDEPDRVSHRGVGRRSDLVQREDGS